MKGKNKIPQRYGVAAAVDISRTASVALTYVPVGRSE
jgi:hypothetical protein